MIKKCENCQKEFKAKSGATKFCSQNCVGLSQRSRVTVTCAACGKPFQTNPSKLHLTKYCSRLCKDGIPQIGHCLNCGLEIKIIKSEVGRKKFCSKICRNLHLEKSRQIRNCPQCFKDFVVTKKNEKTSKFCSVKCLRRAKAEDFTGKKLGKLTVIRRISEIEGDKILVGVKNIWLLKCECGNEIERVLDSVNKKQITSCGCFPFKMSFQDLTGKKFGQLKVTGLNEEKPKNDYYWDCVCDCGNNVRVRGHALRSGKTKACGCQKFVTGEKNWNWKGGRTKTQHGYISLRMADHPSATKGGSILEHRLVMEKIIGRPLLPNENVHHKNGIRTDNHPDNLELWVKSQPCGQRASDLVKFAREILKAYGDLFPE